MREYFKHVFPEDGGLIAVLRIADREGDNEIHPAIELKFAMEGKKKTSFVLLKDSETGESLIPALAECFKNLAESKKDRKLSKCKKCREDFEKTHPAQKYCIACRTGSELATVATVGDEETIETKETKNE